MAAPRTVSDDQEVSLDPLRRPVQQFRDIAAIDDDLGLRANLLLKVGDLLGGEADDHLLPRGIDVGTAGAVELHAVRDVDERKRSVGGRGELGGQRRGVAAATSGRRNVHSERQIVRLSAHLPRLCRWP